MEKQGALLALLKEQDDITVLPSDARRFMAAPPSKATSAMYLTSAFGVTLVGVILVCAAAFGWNIGLTMRPNTALFVLFIGLALCCWAFYAVYGVEKRRSFYSGYERLLAVSPQPRFGTVIDEKSGQSDNTAVIKRCWIEADIDGGGLIQAELHPRRAVLDAEGQNITRNIYHAPRRGNRVAVFEDPQGVLPTLVITNGSRTEGAENQ